MHRNFIETLHCPFSGSSLKVSRVVAENDSGIEYGIVTSEAGNFPIIAGILRLKVDDYRLPLVSLIEEPREALLAALEVPSYGRVAAAMNFLDRTAARANFDHLARYVRTTKKPLYRVLTDTSKTFTETANGLKSKPWANWQIYRFSMPAFLPVYPFLCLMSDGPVLDFGCGLGHASFLISRRIQASNITCADDQFSALYLARKFFVDGANFICLDGDYLLPFETAYFSTVFSSDVVHMIDSKLNLCQEFRRIVSEDGAIILPHLHNKLSPVQFGKSLTPQGYSRLFDGVEKRILPEEWLVDEFISNDSLDLSRQWTSKDLDDAVKGLSVVVSKHVSLFRRYTGLWHGYADRMINPTVNPIYKVSGYSGKWVLEKQLSEPYKGKLTGDNAYLPNTVSVGIPSFDKDAILALKNSDVAAFAELVKKFVFIETPARFR